MMKNFWWAQAIGWAFCVVLGWSAQAECSPKLASLDKGQQLSLQTPMLGDSIGKSSPQLSLEWGGGLSLGVLKQDFTGLAIAFALGAAVVGIAMLLVITAAAVMNIIALITHKWQLGFGIIGTAVGALGLLLGTIVMLSFSSSPDIGLLTAVLAGLAVSVANVVMGIFNIVIGARRRRHRRGYGPRDRYYRRRDGRYQGVEMTVTPWFRIEQGDPKGGLALVGRF